MAFVAKSAASAPPPRKGPPLIPPMRASSIPAAGFEAGLVQAVAAREAAGLAAEASEFDEEAQPVFYPQGGGGEMPVLATVGEEDGPPLEVLEARMLGEVSARDVGMDTGGQTRGGGKAVRRGRVSAEEGKSGVGVRGEPLPELDSLVARLPGGVRTTLEELFRPRFTNVKKLPAWVFGEVE